MSKQTRLDRVAAFSQILAVLSEDAESNPQQRQLCSDLAKNALASLLPCSETSVRNIEKTKCTAFVALFKALYFLNQSPLLKKLGQILTQNSDKFDLHTIVIPVIKELHQWLSVQKIPCPIFSDAFLQPCLQQIKQAATMLIEEPKNWLQNVELSCHCADCTDLAQFLKNPIAKESRFRMRQDRRDHLLNQIIKHHLDISPTTERVGTPHTLVCTKNRASYERAKQQQAIDIDLWHELQQL